MVFTDDPRRAMDIVTDKLRTVGRVNVVRGPMEFGPRALCNTSTLALPTREQVDAINLANNRNTVMPMAPVMTLSRYISTFEDHAKRVWRSHKHMVIALEHQEYPDESIAGVTHKYLAPYVHHTSRPQVTSDPWVIGVLQAFDGILINTSFNYHGRPIAFDTQSVVENHHQQLVRDPSTTTVVITNA
jgi:carbamoyltransferase